MSTKKYYRGILLSLIVIIILILGSIFWSSFVYSERSLDFLNFNKDINLSSPQYNNAGFIIQDPRRVYISQDLKIEENLSYFEEAVLGVFLKKNKTDKTKGADYIIGNEILSGLVISNDGWILLNSLGNNNIATKIMQNKDLYVAVFKKDNKIFEIEEVVGLSSSGLYLLKIKNYNNFPVKNFVNVSNLRNGQSLLAYNFSGQILVNFLNSIDSGLNPKFSGKYENNMLLSFPLSVDFKNSFIFNLNGDLLALVDENLKVLPIHDFYPYIFSFLKNNNVQVFDLGVYYIDLREIVSEDLPAYGALIYNNNLATPAVVKGSLAEQVGLKEGDIITRINNYEVNNYASLNDVWNNFIVNDKLIFSVLRNNEVINLKIDVK